MKNVSSSNSQEVNVPKLRFPGFMDDWSQQEMGSVACYNKKRTTVVKSHFISTENMRQNCNGIDTYYDSTIVEGIEFSENDILIANIRPYLKKAWKAEFSGACSTDVLPIKATGINADFLFHCIEKDDFFNYVMSAAKGSKMPRGDKQHIMEYTIPFPSEREQKKVSAFIGLLSQRITIQRELIEFLKLYKRGASNLLFSEIGTSCDEWMPLQELFAVIPDKKYQVQTNQYFTEGTFEVVDQGKCDIVGFNDDETKLFNDIPVVVYGDHTTIVKYRSKPFIVGGDGVKLLKPMPGFNPQYLYFALCHYNIKQEGYKRHFSILKEISLPIPPIETQLSIKNILDGIDKKITTEELLLTSLIEIKKGLLQKMFI